MATPTQVRDYIQQITVKSQALQPPAQSITIVNGPLIVIGQGPYPKICVGLADIVSTTQTTVSKMDGMSQVAAGKDADAIHETVREFVRINQTLFNMLITKAELFKSMPMISQPVGASIRAIEGVYDQLALALVNNVPGRASDLKSQFGALSQTVQQAIESHEAMGSN